MTTRLILLHGINNEGGSEAALKEAWTKVLLDTAGSSRAFDGLEVRAPFYGDVLHELEHTTRAPNVTSQGAAGLDAGDLALLLPGLLEVAGQAGLGDEAIDAEMGVVSREMGANVHNPRFIAAARLLEKVSPLKGAIALRVLNQAFAYLRRDWVAEAVDGVVMPLLRDPGGAGGEDRVRKIVVAHSLGTVVAYKLIRELVRGGEKATVPLLVTYGSPLPISSVRRSIRGPHRRPPGVGAWLNVYDPSDFVTLGKGIADFGIGVTNRGDARNPPADPHAIESYLGHKEAAGAIVAAATAAASPAGA